MGKLIEFIPGKGISLQLEIAKLKEEQELLYLAYEVSKDKSLLYDLKEIDLCIKTLELELNEERCEYHNLLRTRRKL